jgi:hypothetical protein
MKQRQNSVKTAKKQQLSSVKAANKQQNRSRSL